MTVRKVAKAPKKKAANKPKRLTRVAAPKKARRPRKPAVLGRLTPYVRPHLLDPSIRYWLTRGHVSPLVQEHDLATAQPARVKMTASRAQWFWRNVNQEGGDDACWPWRGAKNRDGYGVVRLPGVKGEGALIYAHRLAYILGNNAGQPTPYDPNTGEPLLVCHACDNPPCCNPAHLDLCSAAQNAAQRQRRLAAGKFVPDVSWGGERPVHAGRPDPVPLGHPSPRWERRLLGPGTGIATKPGRKGRGKGRIKKPVADYDDPPFCYRK